MAKMVKKGDLPQKICQRCGRPMVWRKAWAKTWEAVKYCSDRCKKGGFPPPLLMFQDVHYVSLPLI